MFELKDIVASNVHTDLDDSANIKLAMTSLGHYDDTETGLYPYGDSQLFTAVKDFQKENSLKVDGVVKPEGPTHKTIKKQLKGDERAGSVFQDFKRNFDDMNKTRLHGGDKYFHCKANYEATKRGWLGGLSARVLSDAKEFKDQYIKGYPQSDIDADQKANRHGRSAAKSGKYQSAREACAIFRPEGLDDKY